MIIVVAIIGILAIFAYPAYQDYTIRSKVAEALVQLAPCRAEASAKIQTRKGLSWGETNDSSFSSPQGTRRYAIAGLFNDCIRNQAPSKYVSKIAYPEDYFGTHETIEVTLNIPELGTKNKIFYQPFALNGNEKRNLRTVALCPAGADPNLSVREVEILPIAGWMCRPARNQNSIEAKYVPASCHTERYVMHFVSRNGSADQCGYDGIQE